MYTKIISMAVFAAMIVPSIASASVFDGKIIGLDAGHGGGYGGGATGLCNGVEVPEHFVNEAVRDELTSLINATTTNSSVHQIAQLPTRKERVTDAEANGSDILISIHHNGSNSSTANYTKFFVTQ